jgi:hypothetical protein
MRAEPDTTNNSKPLHAAMGGVRKRWTVHPGSVSEPYQESRDRAPTHEHGSLRYNTLGSISISPRSHRLATVEKQQRSVKEASVLPSWSHTMSRRSASCRHGVAPSKGDRRSGTADVECDADGTRGRRENDRAMVEPTQTSPVKLPSSGQAVGRSFVPEKRGIPMLHQDGHSWPP